MTPAPASARGLEIRELEKVYPRHVVANDGLNLTIEPGEVFGLLGPNGAGKTTLVRQIIGLLRPSRGKITMNGVDLVRHPSVARRLCSYLPQANVPIDSLPMAKAIELIGLIRGGAPESVRRRRDALLDGLEVAAWGTMLGSQLSGGVRRLTGFAMASVHPGRLVILDEPTNDVDPLRRRLLWREVRGLAADGVAVLLVTDNVLEAERSVDRLAIMDHGRIVAQGSPAALKKSGAQGLRFEITLEPGAGAPPLPPFAELQVIMRGTLTEGLVDGVGHSFAVLFVWTAVARVITLRVLPQRGSYRLIARAETAPGALEPFDGLWRRFGADCPRGFE